MELCIVVPCYNEEEVLSESAKQMSAKLEQLITENKISKNSKVVFVDDGSKDRTWEIIEQLSAQSELIEGLKLARNRGHQNALLAGLLTVKGDALISIDADLQDDLNAIDAMVDAYLDGADVVYGVRNCRETDTWFKRTTAQFFYSLMSKLGVDSVYNHADYRLMSRRAIEGLKEFEEVNLFLRGLVPLIGYKSTTVEYKRNERFAGESKYPLKKMLSFALDGITSFSIAPLRLISTIGFITFFISLLLAGWAITVKVFFDSAVPGWTSTVLPLTILAGIQILCTGVIGEYLGKIYNEVKKRPRFIIEKNTDSE